MLTSRLLDIGITISVHAYIFENETEKELALIINILMKFFVRILIQPLFFIV